RDGLYWEAADHDVSPLGPFVASASAEGYRVREAGEAPAPYHGYFFRILTAQGPHAPGGAREYVKEGQMTGGFALVAWPADHGSSGVMTFLVDEQGVVFQKDLGEGTTEAAQAMSRLAAICRFDILRFCWDVSPGHGRVARCVSRIEPISHRSGGRPSVPRTGNRGLPPDQCETVIGREEPVRSRSHAGGYPCWQARAYCVAASPASPRSSAR